MRIPDNLKIDDAALYVLKAVSSYWGITSAAGAGTGLTFVCADLANEPSYEGHTVIIINGPAAGQSRIITNHAAGTETVDEAFTDNTGAVAQITAGIGFIILSKKSEANRYFFCLDFWSDPVEEVQVAAAAGTLNLPDVVVADLPAGAVPVRVQAIFMARMVENTNAAANALDGATVPATSQVIQVRDDTPGIWRDAINFVDNQYTLAATTREAGPVCVGNIDIVVEVDGDDTYNFRWLLADADQDFLNFNDVYTGLRLWFAL